MRNGKLIGINELRINWKRGEECVGEKKQGKAKKKKMENNWKSEKNVGESTALKKIIIIINKRGKIALLQETSRENNFIIQCQQ